MRTVMKPLARAAGLVSLSLLLCSQALGAGPRQPQANYLVSASSTQAADRAVRQVGGQVAGKFEMIDAVGAVLSASQAAELARTPGIRLHTHGYTWSLSAPGPAAPASPTDCRGRERRTTPASSRPATAPGTSCCARSGWRRRRSTWPPRPGPGSRRSRRHDSPVCART